MITCFLCHPDKRLIYLRTDRFFAMLGHGPLGRGYSLIATVEHVPSMFDLDTDEVPELTRFTTAVRARIRPLYGEAVVTEHGRVAACIAEATREYQPHCLHAHRLVFPGVPSIDLGVGLRGTRVLAFPTFDSARAGQGWPGQYLYSENADGRCQVAAAPRGMPRQFFRALIAARRGEPEFANWQAHPRLGEVEIARRELGLE